MTMQDIYDLAVIGAGPAGIVGATTAASLGARVVLIDRYVDLGGAGANTGTAQQDSARNGARALGHPLTRSLRRRSFTAPRNNGRRSDAARARRQGGSTALSRK